MGGKKCTIFFHCKSCPQYQGRWVDKQKLEAGMDQWGDKRVAAAGGVAERERRLSV